MIIERVCIYLLVYIYKTKIIFIAVDNIQVNKQENQNN